MRIGDFKLLVKEHPSGRVFLTIYYKGKRFRYSNAGVIGREIFPNKRPQAQRREHAEFLRSAFIQAIYDGWEPERSDELSFSRRSKFKKFSPEKQLEVAILATSIACELCRQATGSQPTGAEAFLKGAKIGATLESWKKNSTIESITKQALSTGQIYQASNFLQEMANSVAISKLSKDLEKSPEEIVDIYIKGGRRLSRFLHRGLQKAIKLAA